MHYDPSMLNIGNAWQLLVDDLPIESVENVERRWHSPEKCAESPLIQKDRPWEAMPYFTTNTWQVLRDPADGLFKCWYVDWQLPQQEEASVMGGSRFNILYAESEDGLAWNKPELDVCAVDGRRTNICIPNAYNMGIVLDPHEEDPNRRFKAVYTGFRPDADDVAEVVAATSGDGVHWRVCPEAPVLGRSGSRLDDVIILHYDPYARIFVMNTRHYDMYAVARNLNSPVVGGFTPPYYPADWRRMNKRRIWQAESADLIHWGEPYPVATPEDGFDGLDETFYGLCQYPVGGIHLGFLTTFHYTVNTMDVRLMGSRNGKTWKHLNKGQPFIAPSGGGAWDAHLVTLPSKPIEMGDELYVYHGGAKNHHDWYFAARREGLDVPEGRDPGEVGYGLGLAKLRRDGFASIEANAVRRGIFITRPLISGGTRLVVNAKCRAGGSIAAEIVDANDEVVPGFGKEACDVFTGDATRHTFSWGGKAAVPVGETSRASYPQAEFGRMRKVRFYMDNAALYGFGFEE